MKSEVIKCKTTHWMKKGMIIWHSSPGNPQAELRKVVRVIDKTTAEIRPLYWHGLILHDIWKWWTLHIRNPFMRTLWKWRNR